MTGNLIYIEIKLLDFGLVSKFKECDGSEVDKGKVRSYYACADKCRFVSSMFIFGANSQKCSGTPKQCQCYCETASRNGKCKGKEIDHSGYHLLAFKPIIDGTNPLIYHIFDSVVVESVMHLLDVLCAKSRY